VLLIGQWIEWQHCWGNEMVLNPSPRIVVPGFANSFRACDRIARGIVSTNFFCYAAHAAVPWTLNVFIDKTVDVLD
jgi:hypothetical protein